MPLTRTELDQLRCTVPDCDAPEGHPIGLNAQCCGVPFFVVYVPSDSALKTAGCLETRCARCGEPGPAIVVAEGPAPDLNSTVH